MLTEAVHKMSMVHDQTEQKGCEHGHSFGSKYLLLDQRETPMVSDIILKAGSKLAEIFFMDLFFSIGGDLEEVLEKNKDSHENYHKAEEHLCMSKKWTKDDFVYIQQLG